MRLRLLTLCASLAAFVTAGLMSGCSSTDEHPPGSGQGPLSIPLLTSIPLGPEGEAGPVALDAGRIVFPTSDKTSGRWDAVTSVDLSTSRPRIVARTGFRAGMINFVAPLGDWTVYVDQSAKQSDAAPRVRWRVIATNGKGERRVLATNGNRPDPFVPVVRSQGGYVTWTSAEPDKSARQLLWQPDWAAPRDVVRHATFGPGSAHIDGQSMSYIGAPQVKRPKIPTNSDCWRVSLGGGNPEPLTHRGLAMECATDGDRVVWSEHIDPARADEAEDVSDNPYELLTSQAGGAPSLLHRGYFQPSTLTVVGAYVLWTDFDGFWTLTSLVNPKQEQRFKGDAAVNDALADGDRLVLVMSTDGREVAQVYDARLLVKR